MRGKREREIDDLKQRVALCESEIKNAEAQVNLWERRFKESNQAMNNQRSRAEQLQQAMALLVVQQTEINALHRKTTESSRVALTVNKKETEVKPSPKPSENDYVLIHGVDDFEKDELVGEELTSKVGVAPCIPSLLTLPCKTSQISWKRQPGVCWTCGAKDHRAFECPEKK